MHRKLESVSISISGEAGKLASQSQRVVMLLVARCPSNSVSVYVFSTFPSCHFNSQPLDSPRAQNFNFHNNDLGLERVRDSLRSWWAHIHFYSAYKYRYIECQSQSRSLRPKRMSILGTGAGLRFLRLPGLSLSVYLRLPPSSLVYFEFRNLKMWQVKVGACPRNWRVFSWMLIIITGIRHV